MNEFIHCNGNELTRQMIIAQLLLKDIGEKRYTKKAFVKNYAF